MSNMRELWWDQEVSHRFQVLQVYLLVVAAVTIGFKCFTVAYFGSQSISFHMQMLPAAILLLVALVTRKVSQFSTRKRVLYAFVITEVFNSLQINLAHSYLQDHASILLIGTTMTMLYFQFSMFKSTWISCLLTTKFAYQWYFSRLLRQEITMTIVSSPYVAMVASVIICYYNESAANSNGLNAFCTQRKLEETQKQLDSLIQLYPQALVVLDEALQIKLTNHKFVEWFGPGLRTQSLLGTLTYCNGRKYAGDLSESKVLLDDIAICNRMEVNNEVSLGICKCRQSYLEVQCKKIEWGPQGKVLIVVFNEVNQLIELEKSRAEVNFKNTLIKSVSHELRTPTNAIANFTHSVLVSETLSETARNKLNFVMVSSKLLLNIINDLIDYSAIVAGVFSLAKVEFKIRDTLDEVISLIQPQAISKQLSLSLRVDPHLPATVYTDPLKLTQILLNLVSNSLKFTMRGYIEVTAILNSEAKLELSVEDSGIGITEEKIEDIVKGFRKKDTCKNVSSGLGLCISNILVKTLGGENLKIVSRVSKGTRFTFQIDIGQSVEKPFSYDDVESESVFSESPSFDNAIHPLPQRNQNKNNAPKVLIVDDNDFNLLILEDILNRYQLQYIKAMNGKEAVELVKRYDTLDKPIKVILMDYKMPVMSGCKAATTIRELYIEHSLKHFPNIIGYSCYSTEEYRVKCLKSGMVNFYVKPAKPETLISLIYQYLD